MPRWHRAPLAPPEWPFPKRHAFYKLRHRVSKNITAEEFERLSGQAACDICGAEVPLRFDHSGTRLRGMLCHHCNVGLGHFRDDPALLLRAAQYIEEFQGDNPFQGG